MKSIYFVGTYKPIMCGIADYTSFITRVSPISKWGVLSFNLEKYGAPLAAYGGIASDRVWYGIPSCHEYSASVILEGVNTFGAQKEDSILWLQHEFGIWPGNIRFVAMLKN